MRRLVVFPACALPRDQLANRRTGGRCRLLVGLYFLTRCFLAYGFDTEADFFLILIHLDDLEVEFSAGLEVDGLTLVVHGFGVVAETFDSVRDLNEGAEICDTQNLAVDNVTDSVLCEEAVPDVGLKLLYAQ